jgi:hypothetical protein
MTERRFPPPWSVETFPGGLKVCDANGQSLAYVYSRENASDAHEQVFGPPVNNLESRRLDTGAFVFGGRDEVHSSQRGSKMHSVMRVTVAATVLGIAALSLTVSAHAGNGSAVGAGIVGFGVGAIVGNALAPQTVYVAPPPPVYYAPPPPVYVAPAPPVYVGPVYYERHPYRGHRR